MRLVPVVGSAGIDLQGHAHVERRHGGVFHDRDDERNGLLDIGILDLEDQFVMHLQKHPGAVGQACILQGRLHADHGAADDIGCGPLNRRIDRGAFVEGAHGRVRRADFRVVRSAPEDRLDIAVLAGKGLGRIHIVADTGEALEILLDVIAGFGPLDRQLVGKAEGRYAVDDAEVDRLGAAADFARHALDGNTEHFRCRHGMDIDAVGEGLAQLRNVGDMGENPQFDLAVVGRNELVAGGRDEGRADLAAFRGAYRYVL